MDLENFLKDFYDEEMELLVLIQKDIGGAGVHGDYLNPHASVLAYINLETGTMCEEAGLLEWMIKKNSQRKNWGFDLRGMKIYRVRVRRHREKNDGKNWIPQMHNRYLLLEILESDVEHPRLNVIREAYQKPIVIGDSQIGYFSLNRDYEWYEAQIDWLGNECDVRLELDENSNDTANNALAAYRKLLGGLETWNNKFKMFAADKLISLANEWQAEYEEDNDEQASITEEEFMKRIQISEISIDSEGDMEITYLDDDIFYGHWIVVYANINGELKSADIEG